MIENLILGATAMMGPINLLVLFLGTSAGIFFGAIPGLSNTMVIALFLPVSFTLPPLEGMSLLVALYIGGMSGGLIPAVLINIPGTPASVATCFDGYPMTKKGQAMKALGIGLVASFIGTIISVIFMIFASSALARAALAFGPFEYFAIAFFSLSLISSLAGKSMLKGILMALFGMMFATIGMAPIDGAIRFNFGSRHLAGNLDVLTVLVGMFALSEIMVNAEITRNNTTTTNLNVDYKSVRGFGFTMAEFKSQISNLARSIGIGLGVGVLPGIGASTINLMAYAAARSRSKHPEKFGTGIIDGVVATESSNSASVGGAMVPLMALGIPGDIATAMLLGGLMIHGLTPGPLLFAERPVMVYGIFVGMMLATFIMLAVQYYGIRLFIKVLVVPRYILMPIIFTMCIVGAFGINNRIFDTYVVVFFGVLGYLFSKFKLPIAPLIMGFILGPMAETFLRRALMLSQGSYAPFITRPISGVFIVATLLFLTFTAVKRIKTGGN